MLDGRLGKQKIEQLRSNPIAYFTEKKTEQLGVLKSLANLGYTIEQQKIRKEGCNEKIKINLQQNSPNRRGYFVLC